MRTKAVSSCGLEMSAGLASGFDGPGEAPLGVLEPWSPLEDPFTEATLSGWAESGDDISAKRIAFRFFRVVLGDLYVTLEDEMMFTARLNWVAAPVAPY